MLNACVPGDTLYLYRLPARQQARGKENCSRLLSLRPSWGRWQLRLQPLAAYKATKVLLVSAVASADATEPEQGSSLVKRADVPATIANRDIETLLNQMFQLGHISTQSHVSLLITADQHSNSASAEPSFDLIASEQQS